ncbi:MAG: hypothetical protein HQL75_00220 [Magnetococcales bacterium]|nr:hypothetical protein [Magnetococcales bacterium]
MIRYADRISQRATVTGTASYVLGVEIPSFRGVFSIFNAGEQFTYCAQLDSLWEVGIGTVVVVGADITISRTTILSSSSANTAVPWAAASVVTISCVHAANQIEETYLLAKKPKLSKTIQTVGTLKVQTGQNRWYPPSDVTLTKMSVWVGVASSGNDIEFTLRKNGIPAITGSLAAGLNRVEVALPDAHAYAWKNSLAEALADINDNNFFDNVTVFVGMRVFIDGLLGTGDQTGVYIVSGTPNNYTITATPTPFVGQVVRTSGGGTAGRWMQWMGEIRTDWTNWDVIPEPSEEILNADSVAINLPLTHRDYLTLDVTQVGSPQPGANLSVRLME